MPRLRSSLALLAVLASAGGCGAEKQDRPVVVSTFPAEGQVLPGWLGAARVTFDEDVTILNEDAARCEGFGDDGGAVTMRILPDPLDPRSILLVPAEGSHFFPSAEHELVVEEGAVVNSGQHYALDEHVVRFTLGPPPNLFLTAEDGAIYEIDPATGAQVSVTLPGAGFAARSPLASEDRVWVWLDPTVPGSSLLGTFVPGAATVTELVPLAGETGTVLGGRTVLSPDGRTLYATAEDAGTQRAFLHRIDVATRTEILPALELSPALAGSPATFQPALDGKRDRLYVPFSDGAGGGSLAIVDLAAWLEVDVGPAVGLDALPVAAGAGDAAYEWTRDDVTMVLSDETTAGLVRLRAGDEALEIKTARESIVGRPTALLPLPDGGTILFGLDGYVDRDGIVRVEGGNLDNGSPLIVDDDVGGASQGCDHVIALLLDPSDRRFFTFAENGATTILVLYEYSFGGMPVPVDFDDVNEGTQGLDLGPALNGSIATGATTLPGAFPP